MNINKLVQQALDGNKPKWCKHIKFWVIPAGSDGDGGWNEAYGGWSFPSDEAPCGLSGTVAKWKFCPMCAAPRPY